MKTLTIKIIALVSIVFTVGLAGCATTPQPKFNADTVNQIKAGMTKTEVTNMLGEPRSRSVDNDGNETWQYRKAAKQGKGMQTFMNIGSFGMASAFDPIYQDILNVTFTNNIVAKVTYQENVNLAGTMLNH